MSLNLWDILRSPVITEETMLLKEVTSEEGEGQVLTFRVDKSAGKDDIRQAVEEIFNVKVATVRTINYQGKMKRRGRTSGRRPNWKKAYVTLKKGEPAVGYEEI